MHYKELVRGVNINTGDVDRIDFPQLPYKIEDSNYMRALETGNPHDVRSFLKSWNPRVDFNFDQLTNLIMKKTECINKIRYLFLHNVDLWNISIDVKSLFCSFDEVVKHTGASKALHVLSSSLFILWDDRIRKGYGCFHNAEGYFNFLIRMQWELREVLKTYRCDFSCNSDDEAIDQICQKLYEGGKMPITKLLDEYNYQKYTKKRL